MGIWVAIHANAAQQLRVRRSHGTRALAACAPLVGVGVPARLRQRDVLRRRKGREARPQALDSDAVAQQSARHAGIGMAARVPR